MLYRGIKGIIKNCEISVYIPSIIRVASSNWEFLICRWECSTTLNFFHILTKQVSSDNLQKFYISLFFLFIYFCDLSRVTFQGEKNLALIIIFLYTVVGLGETFTNFQNSFLPEHFQATASTPFYSTLNKKLTLGFIYLKIKSTFQIWSRKFIF